jgi:hypothetical protein
MLKHNSPLGGASQPLQLILVQWNYFLLEIKDAWAKISQAIWFVEVFIFIFFEF